MKQFFLALAMTLIATGASAESTVSIENAWVREAPPSAHMMAAYMTLVNSGEQARTLVDVSSPAFAHVMLHESKVVDGVARMLHLDTIEIPAQGRVELKPGGYHLMMPAPDSRLVEGDSVEFELRFADGSSMRVQAGVRKKP